MPDLTPALLPHLQAHRLPNFDFGNEGIHPHYGGFSILNLPSSLCHLWGVPPLGKAPLLAPEILSPLGSSFRRVILVLMDALSLHRLQRWIAEGWTPIWEKLIEGGQLAPLTSITPSTTSAALACLWSGRSAAEHGIIGYELWLKEYGVVANAILHAPITFKNDIGSLEKAGFTPESFLGLPTLGTHLAAHGVKSYAFQHKAILHSGLSQMLFKDVETRAFNTPTDLWVNLRDFLNERPHERQFIWVYWGEVDHFSHFYGPDDERSAEEFIAFSAAMERLFLSRLNSPARRDTLLLLTADHGQITTRKDPHHDLRNHPDLTRRLHLLPTGENRLMYLFLKPGQSQAVLDYFKEKWPGQFEFIQPFSAVRAGLFGPGKPHPRLFDRLGDVIALARGDSYLWWANKDNPLIGRHGGLSPEEMLVPLLAVRL
jgi:hypothetical protein